MVHNALMKQLMKQLIKEHQWTIDAGKFICKECKYIANEEESRFLTTCCYSSYNADIYGKINESLVHLVYILDAQHSFLKRLWK